MQEIWSAGGYIKVYKTGQNRHLQPGGYYAQILVGKYCLQNVHKGTQILGVWTEGTGNGSEAGAARSGNRKAPEQYKTIRAWGITVWTVKKRLFLHIWVENAIVRQTLGVCIYSVLTPICVVVLLAQFFFYLCQFCFQILYFAFICFPVDLLLQLFFLLF